MVGNRMIDIRSEVIREGKHKGRSEVIIEMEHVDDKERKETRSALRDERKDLVEMVRDLKECLINEGEENVSIYEQIMIEGVTKFNRIFELEYNRLEEELEVSDKDIFDAGEIVEEPKPFTDVEAEFFEDSGEIELIEIREQVKDKIKYTDERSDAYFDLTAEVEDIKYLDMLIRTENKGEKNKREKYFVMLMGARGEVVLDSMKKTIREGIKRKKGEEKENNIQGASIRILKAVEERKPRFDDLFAMVGQYITDKYDPIAEGSFKRVVKGLYELLKD